MTANPSAITEEEGLSASDSLHLFPAVPGSKAKEEMHQHQDPYSALDQPIDSMLALGPL